MCEGFAGQLTWALFIWTHCGLFFPISFRFYCYLTFLFQNICVKIVNFASLQMTWNIEWEPSDSGCQLHKELLDKPAFQQSCILVSVFAQHSAAPFGGDAAQILESGLTLWLFNF